MAMKRYTVRARRSGDWWAIDVPELPGVFTQVRRLAQADAMARDAIATMLDVNPDRIRVDIQPVLSEAKLTQAVIRLRELQSRETALQAELNAVAASTAKKLVARGYTLRDAGRVMGLSFQRIHQLSRASDKPRRRRQASA